jgi:hypothetical protein
LSGDSLGEPEDVDEAAESLFDFRLKSDEMRRAVFGADNMTATLTQHTSTKLVTTPGVTGEGCSRRCGILAANQGGDQNS